MKTLLKKDLKELLNLKGIKPTYPRVAILHYILKYKTHPTADEIFNALLEDIPSLSIATVYNTIKLFLQKQLLAEVTIEENELRVDGNVEPHIHFKCEICQKIYDCYEDKKETLLDKKFIDGHKILQYHINFKGICRTCLKDKKNSRKEGAHNG